MKRRGPGWGGVIAALFLALAVAAALAVPMFTGGCG